LIEDLSEAAGDRTIEGDVAVVGAGPAGIVTALELAQRGLTVVLLESGGVEFDPTAQPLSEADNWDHERHAPMSLAIRRQLGGTSTIWGGRCVPYDPVDFEVRPFITSASWPVGYEEIRTYFERACGWLVCGRPVFNTKDAPHLPGQLVPGLVDGDVTSSSLERWSLPTNFGKTYHATLLASRNIRVFTGVTSTEVVCHSESRSAQHLEARTRTGQRVTITAQAFVLAGGGLETTRLLLSSMGPQGTEPGNHSGHLGRWYMAHTEGVVADVHFDAPPKRTIYGYERDIDGVYIRRRLAFTESFQVDHELPNIVSWMANPELSDAAHQNGPLSFVYLALRSPLGPRFAPDAQRIPLTGARIPGTPYGGATRTSVGSHLANMLRSPLATASFIGSFGVRRFVGERRAPGFFAYNKHNIYPLQFHGEHRPSWESRVTLSNQRDGLGRRMLDIDLKFSDEDVDGVVRAHEYWDSYLRSLGVGSLAYHSADVHEAVTARLGGGFHQVGTTRMAASPLGGVVDKHLSVFGVENLYVASSSAFVTSGQANSTFMVVAFAVRLADHIAHKARPPAVATGTG
jgi:hypothetical protein